MTHIVSAEALLRGLLLQGSGLCGRLKRPAAAVWLLLDSLIAVAAQSISASFLGAAVQQVAAQELQSSQSLHAFLLQSPLSKTWLLNSPGGIRTCDQSVNSRPLYH
jgi:hypothetical protein